MKLCRVKIKITRRMLCTKLSKAEKLNEIVYLMVVEALMVAKHCQPGQFIIVKEDDAGSVFL